MSKPRKEKFTPGPWRRGQDGNLRIYGPDGRGEHSGPLAEILPKNGFQTANARLIAAAPDLYVAVGSLLKAFNQLIPGMGNISCSDYANINIAPILAGWRIALLGQHSAIVGRT